MPPQIKLDQPAEEGKPQLRFAEDIITPRRTKQTEKATKGKKKRKGSYQKDTSEDGGKARKGRRDYSAEEEEEEYY